MLIVRSCVFKLNSNHHHPWWCSGENYLSVGVISGNILKFGQNWDFETGTCSCGVLVVCVLCPIDSEVIWRWRFHLLSFAKEVKLCFYTIPTGNRTPGRQLAVHYITAAPRQFLVEFGLVHRSNRNCNDQLPACLRVATHLEIREFSEKAGKNSWWKSKGISCKTCKYSDESGKMIFCCKCLRKKMFLFPYFVKGEEFNINVIFCNTADKLSGGIVSQENSGKIKTWKYWPPFELSCNVSITYIIIYVATLICKKVAIETPATIWYYCKMTSDVETQNNKT